MAPEILVQSDLIAGRISCVFELFRAQLHDLLGSDVDTHHVGATSIPGLLTKGDLDLLVRADPESFERAAAVLDRNFTPNTGSVRTGDFSAYIAKSSEVDVGIQLVAAGGKFDFFLLFRDRLLQSASLRDEYNRIKRLAWPGGHDRYRAAKARFIHSVIDRARSG